MEVLEIYKCEVCGNIVEVFTVGGGELVCCNQPMKKMEENSVDAAKEKHVPVVEVNGDKVTVKVGEVEHPMTEEHHIAWIEAITDSGVVYTKHLKHTEKPVFEFTTTEKITKVREYCNLHGLWITTEIK